MPTLIDCKNNLQLPKSPLWCYGRGGVKSLEDAVAQHQAKRRGMPDVVYHLKGEYYFPVVA